MEILAELFCDEMRALEKSEALFFFAYFTMSITENYFKEEFKMNMLTKKNSNRWRFIRGGRGVIYDGKRAYAWRIASI